MRNLDFKITGQAIEGVGDFSGLVPGTAGYLVATFDFSEEWSGCVKVASFFDRRGNEHARIIQGNRTEIPKEVLVDRYFRVRVVGQKKDYQIVTNIIKIVQGGDA